MRLLFVANRMPYPPFRGDKLKIYNLAKELCDEHEIHLVTIAESKEDFQHIPELNKIFTSVQAVYLPKYKSYLNTIMGLFSKKPLQVSYFKSTPFEKLLISILKEYSFDGIHVQHLRISQYHSHLPLERSILDLPDAFSLYWKRRYLNSKNWFVKAFNYIEYRKLEKYEQSILPIFPIVLVCSKEDQQYLSLQTKGNIQLLQNGVDTVAFAPREGIGYIEHRVLFTGNMDYAPNIDAVTYFSEEIWPSVVSKIPSAKFIIAGQRPVPKVLALASETIEILGFIPNLADEYAKAHVVISPLRIGAGTQNKVLESLSMDIPVITTHVGYEGLELPENTGALLSETPEQFIDNLLKVLSNDSFRQELGKKGGEHIRKNFSWKIIAKKLENYLKKIQNHE